MCVCVYIPTGKAITTTDPQDPVFSYTLTYWRTYSSTSWINQRDFLTSSRASARRRHDARRLRPRRRTMSSSCAMSHEHEQELGRRVDAMSVSTLRSVIESSGRSHAEILEKHELRLVAREVLAAQLSGGAAPQEPDVLATGARGVRAERVSLLSADESAQTNDHVEITVARPAGHASERAVDPGRCQRGRARLLLQQCAAITLVCASAGALVAAADLALTDNALMAAAPMAAAPVASAPMASAPMAVPLPWPAHPPRSHLPPIPPPARAPPHAPPFWPLRGPSSPCTPPRSPPGSPISPPLHPHLPPPLPPLSLVDAINARYDRGAPANDLYNAGVFVSQLDAMHDPVRPWLPCPINNTRVWCWWLGDRISGSIISRQQVALAKQRQYRPLFDSSLGGFVLSP